MTSLNQLKTSYNHVFPPECQKPSGLSSNTDHISEQTLIHHTQQGSKPYTPIHSYSNPDLRLSVTH